MDREQLRARLFATFVVELDEHARTLDAEALELEKDTGARRAEILQTLFRAAHSLKGAARSAGVAPIETLCHRLEETLAHARDDTSAPAVGLPQLLLAAADALGDAGARLRAKEDPTGGPLGALLDRLAAQDALARKGSLAPAGPRTRPPGRSDTVRTSTKEPPPAEAIPAPPRTRSSAPPSPEPAAEPPKAPPAPLPAAEPPPPRPAPEATLPPPGPAAPPAEVAPPPPGSAGPPPAAAPPSPVRAVGAGRAPALDRVVRLQAAKLDSLVARSGELFVARRRASTRHTDLSHLSELVADCLADWHRVAAPLRGLVAAAPSSGAAAAPALRPLPRRAAQAFARTGDGLRKLERGLARLSQALASDEQEIGQIASALEDGVRRLRMSPFGEACESLERHARDIATGRGKEVNVVLEGGGIEVDRTVLDALRDPLRHLVRNAVDHGLEPPSERQSRGKPRRGTITISAALRGGGVQVVVADDGRGLDVAAIRARAAKLGAPAPDDDRDLGRLIFRPGFSTAPAVTELSGRGVGLDVVKHAVEALHGSVEVAFEPGRGTRFAMLVPLTLTTLRALLVVAGGQVHAIPSANVDRLVQAGAGEIASVEGRDALLLDEAPILAVSLAGALGAQAGERPQAGAKVPFVVVSSSGRRAAFAVDELVAEQDVVVKGLGPRVRRVRHVAGATVLPSGDLALILSASDLVETALARGAGEPLLAPPAAAARPRRRLLIADDSVTTRSLVKSILEGAGYEVLDAPDGAHAWQLLQDRGADLVVSDVEMPRMDGFVLTETIRASARFRELPVVLVTGLESDRDRARGLDAGADAYLPKGTFDQSRLLDVVQELLGEAT